jgi:hypothetical protein
VSDSADVANGHVTVILYRCWHLVTLVTTYTDVEKSCRRSRPFHSRSAWRGGCVFVSDIQYNYSAPGNKDIKMKRTVDIFQKSLHL